MRILAIDFGTKRAGLAISDGESSVAHKYGIINRSEATSFVSEVLGIAKKEKIDLLLVGMPLSLTGKPSKMSEEVEKFIVELKEKTSISIKTIDERFSSKSAEANIGTRDKGAIDQEAARIILQQYLDKE